MALFNLLKLALSMTRDFFIVGLSVAIQRLSGQDLGM
jgi:hypothetical protein